MSFEERLQTFFEYVFGDCTGYLAIGNDIKSDFQGNAYFAYPAELPQALQYIENKKALGNVWFCNQLLKGKTRSKTNVIDQATFIWADLDECHPSKMLLEPSMVIESSTNRYQAIWKLKEPIDPLEAEELSRRIYLAHKKDGVDKCWNLARLLRIPFTHNYKYLDTPPVHVKHAHDTVYEPSDFDLYPPTEEGLELTIKIPDTFPQKPPEEILDKVRARVSPAAWQYLAVAPKEDWSGALWHLIRALQEAGLSNDEVFVVTASCPVNKYKRDNNPKWDQYLWRDIVKASNTKVEFDDYDKEDVDVELLSDLDRYEVENTSSVIDMYVEWASKRTDSPVQYHTSAAFMVLSCLLAGTTRVSSSIGNIAPNLWMLILGETTITRKSTAMKLARDLVMDIDPMALLAY